MRIPPYYKQEKDSTCSLAILRMVLGSYGIPVTEKELEEKIQKDYGKSFTNIWNPTIAKLACEYGINTTLCADWPILDDKILYTAIEDYKKDPISFNVYKYENNKDKDFIPEPLSLSYKELFLAVEKGCKTHYEKISALKVKELLKKDYLIQTSIKLNIMYPRSKSGFHSILIYGIDNDTVFYHDPYRGERMNCNINHLIESAQNIGAYMYYCD